MSQGSSTKGLGSSIVFSDQQAQFQPLLQDGLLASPKSLIIAHVCTSLYLLAHSAVRAGIVSTLQTIMSLACGLTTVNVL